MSRSALELRPWWVIGLAYIVAPVVALTALWLFVAMSAVLSPPAEDFDASSAMELWALLLVMGGGVCLAVEAVVITPILVGFSRFRWRWLNGWSALAIGFSLGALPLLVAGLWPPDPSRRYVVSGEMIVPSTERTWADLSGVLGGAAMMGGVGLVAAAIFCLMAVRRTPASQ